MIYSAYLFLDNSIIICQGTCSTWSILHCRWKTFFTKHMPNWKPI